MTRAKFYCQAVKDFGNDYQVVTFQADTNKSDSDTQHYSKYTPSGTLEITVTNPVLTGKFKPGSRYYLDITEADA